MTRPTWTIVKMAADVGERATKANSASVRANQAIESGRATVCVSAGQKESARSAMSIQVFAWPHLQLSGEHGRERKKHERAQDERKDVRVGRQARGEDDRARQTGRQAERAR
jgi:hypothetical protein